MKVALCWAPPNRPPGSAIQAVRGHSLGFSQAGHDIDVFYGNHLNTLVERQALYDVVIWPSNLYNTHQIRGLDIHKHVHLIGVDDPGKHIAFQEMLDGADSMSAVDLNPALYFSEKFDVDREISIVPNAPNTDVFSPQEENNGPIFSPKIGAPQKEGDSLIEIAELTPNSVYEAHSDHFIEVPFNVHVLPPVPWSMMPRRYAETSKVVNPSRNEGLPNVAYEAFCSNRTYISKKSAIGRVQSIPSSELDEGDFGADASWFQEQYKDLFYAGEHAVMVDTTDEVVHAVRTDVDTAREGREWIDSLSWSWQDVAETLTESFK